MLRTNVPPHKQYSPLLVSNQGTSICYLFLEEIMQYRCCNYTRLTSFQSQLVYLISVNCVQFLKDARPGVPCVAHTRPHEKEIQRERETERERELDLQPSQFQSASDFVLVLIYLRLVFYQLGTGLDCARTMHHRVTL